jgi:sugar phosphate isomerase/epimerase
LADEIRDHFVPCLSVHAPEGLVVGSHPDDFLTWARSVREFAVRVGAKVIVFHPVRAISTSYSECLKILSSNIKALQQESRAADVVLETFKGGQYFSYEDIIAAGLPICLDTSHMSHKEALTVVERHHDQMRHVHLSRATDDMTHIPVKKRGISIIKRLAEYQWSGTVCLEYLDWYAEEMIKDCHRFVNIFG